LTGGRWIGNRDSDLLPLFKRNCFQRLEYAVLVNGLKRPFPYGFSVTDLRFQSNDPTTCNELLFYCRAIAVFGWKTAEKCGRFTTQLVEVIQKTSLEGNS
jgi:hypothetical protein